MSYNISTIHDFISFIERKERGVFTLPAQKDAVLDAGQMDVFKKYFSLYGETQEIHDAINPFKVNYQFASAADGTVTLPTDYMHLLPNVFTVTGSTVNKVRFLNEDEWVDAIDNQLRPVSTARPIAKDYGNGFNLYPQTAQTGFLTYVRRPVTPVYGYSQVGRVITYNSATSTQIEFSDVYITEIIARAMFYLGYNLSEQDIVNFQKEYNQQ